jgi:hypothetical protein
MNLLSFLARGNILNKNLSQATTVNATTTDGTKVDLFQANLASDMTTTDGTKVDLFQANLASDMTTSPYAL